MLVRPEGFVRKHEPVLVTLLNAVDVAGHTAVAATQYQERPVLALVGAVFALANTYAIGLQTHELHHNNKALTERLERKTITPHRGSTRKTTKTPKV